MTLRPDGDAGSPPDGFPGSLFVMGHDRMPYGELPTGNQVAEVTIPAPAVSANVGDLPVASFLQSFQDVSGGLFAALEEVPTAGMQFLNIAATGPRIHLAWGQHFQPEPAVPSHAWFSPTLSAPGTTGAWFLGNQSQYSVNGYLMEIPAAWADVHTGGRYVGTGRQRDGGWGGMGPSLYAYRPWVDSGGTPAPPGTHLEETVLLRYESSEATSDIVRCFAGYQHADTFVGGAFLTTTGGKSSVVFAGTKGTGAKYWYGFVNPLGPSYPCPEQASIPLFTACRLASGEACPPEDLVECGGHTSERGWWSARFDAQIVFYDPEELARVAAGEIQPHVPQPYATLDLDDRLFLNPSGVDPDSLGTGIQRRYRLGDVTFDRQNGLLYVLELFAEDAQPVVHVWRVAPGSAPSPPLRFFTLAPCRILDTRQPAGDLGGPALAAQGSPDRSFPVRASACQIPQAARALAVNVTVVNAAAAGDVLVYAGDLTDPGAPSTVAFQAGRTRAAMTTLRLAADGSGSVKARNRSAGTVDLILDVNGYFAE